MNDEEILQALRAGWPIPYEYLFPLLERAMERDQLRAEVTALREQLLETKAEMHAADHERDAATARAKAAEAEVERLRACLATHGIPDESSWRPLPGGKFEVKELRTAHAKGDEEKKP